jgi:hypothetical protein
VHQLQVHPQALAAASLTFQFSSSVALTVRPFSALSRTADTKANAAKSGSGKAALGGDGTRPSAAAAGGVKNAPQPSTDTGSATAGAAAEKSDATSSSGDASSGGPSIAFFYGPGRGSNADEPRGVTVGELTAAPDSDAAPVPLRGAARWMAVLNKLLVVSFIVVGLAGSVYLVYLFRLKRHARQEWEAANPEIVAKILRERAEKKENEKLQREKEKEAAQLAKAQQTSSTQR